MMRAPKIARRKHTVDGKAARAKLTASSPQYCLSHRVAISSGSIKNGALE
jgi:hypothetical protein